MKLWLVRHAQVQIAPQLCYGASDIAAGPDATAQAAAALAGNLPQGLPLYTSTLGRCRQLGAALHALRPDLGPPVADARLNEMNFGTWELQAWSAIPKSAIDAWVQDFAWQRFGGSESTQMVVNRVLDFVHFLHAQQTAQAICICHAGTMRALHYIAENGAVDISSTSAWPKTSTPFGSAVALDIHLDRDKS